MKIFVEGGAFLEKPSGVGHYGKRLTEALARNFPSHHVTIFGFRFFLRPLPHLPVKPTANLNYRFMRLLPARAYNLLIKLGMPFPIDPLLLRRADVFLFPNFVCWPTLQRRAKVIVAIHDLSFIHYSQYTSPPNLRYMTRFVPKSIKRADHIITISESSRRDIIDYYKVSPDKVSIVVPAIDPAVYHPQSQATITRIRKKYKLPEKYILYAGNLEPRKNIEGLLKAYESLDKNVHDQFALVLVGGKGWLDDRIHAEIQRLQDHNIVLTGYVPDEDMPALYSGAAVFTFPSFFEGFGMPPLEAMACGTPVITSNTSSLPEVVGDAALLIDPYNIKTIAEALTTVLTNKVAAQRLSKLGLAQAKKFSWDKSAHDFMAVVDKVTDAN
jgi:glycosyltransferase involved in cell wall biosynthesis